MCLSDTGASACTCERETVPRRLEESCSWFNSSSSMYYTLRCLTEQGEGIWPVLPCYYIQLWTDMAGFGIFTNPWRPSTSFVLSTGMLGTVTPALRQRTVIRNLHDLVGLPVTVSGLRHSFPLQHSLFISKWPRTCQIFMPFNHAGACLGNRVLWSFCLSINVLIKVVGRRLLLPVWLGNVLDSHYSFMFETDTVISIVWLFGQMCFITSNVHICQLALF